MKEICPKAYEVLVERVMGRRRLGWAIRKKT